MSYIIHLSEDSRRQNHYRWSELCESQLIFFLIEPFGAD